MKPTPARNRMIAALWKALEDRGITLAQAGLRVGRGNKWLWDRKRVAFDIGDFWEVLEAADIDPVTFLSEVFPELGTKEADKPKLKASDEKDLERARKRLEKGK